MFRKEPSKEPSKEPNQEPARPAPVHLREPSGIKLVLTPDSDCILQFRTIRDISDRVGAPEGEALITSWFDGLKVVSMPLCFAIREAVDSLQKGTWYYLHHQGDIEIEGRTPMKDIDIWKLGASGDTLKVEDLPHPKRIAGEDVLSFALTNETVAIANYSRLNYPLRPPA